MIVKKSFYEVFFIYFFNKNMEEREYLTEISKIEEELRSKSASYGLRIKNHYGCASCVEKSQEEIAYYSFSEEEMQNEILLCKKENKYLRRRDVLVWEKKVATQEKIIRDIEVIQAFNEQIRKRDEQKIQENSNQVLKKSKKGPITNNVTYKPKRNLVQLMENGNFIKENVLKSAIGINYKVFGASLRGKFNLDEN